MADTELAEVADFLAGHAPFAALPARVLRALPARLTIRYHRRGSSLMAVGVDNHDLIIVRSGAIEIRDADGGLVDRCAEGSTAGSTTLIGPNPSRFDVVAIEDTLALHLPAEVFHELSQAHPDFADHFDAERGDRLRTAVSSVATNPAGEAILRTSARDPVHRAPVSVGDDVTIAEAARVMTDEGVSSLLVMDGRGVVGILTDRDLRRRVLAVGVDPAGPVTSVMTTDPVVAAADTSALELLVTMTERTIHHLPVVEAGRPLGGGHDDGPDAPGAGQHGAHRRRRVEAAGCRRGRRDGPAPAPARRAARRAGRGR
uniref:CBS domain-containing protein n=1 Tax=Janibacter limosus TaxID=53458 RepID=A0AC61U3W2_9MICO|nr:CBS domain-containing protein [Janibacter limosus]